MWRQSSENFAEKRFELFAIDEFADSIGIVVGIRNIRRFAHGDSPEVPTNFLAGVSPLRV